MNISDVITFDLLSYYDGKLKDYISQLYSTKTETDQKDTAVLTNVLSKIWSNTNGDNTGNFQTKYLHDDGSYAMMWNESDGGGAQYFNKNANIISYVGVNDGGLGGLYAQIYALDKTTKNGVRINVTPTGAYYNVSGAISFDPQYELATKGDVVAVQGEIPTTLSAFTNDADFITTAAVDAKIHSALTSAVVYKGSVQTYEDLPTSGQKVGDMYDVQESENNYIWNGTSWDSTTKLITFEFATREQIESLFD